MGANALLRFSYVNLKSHTLSSKYLSRISLVHAA